MPSSIYIFELARKQREFWIYLWAGRDNDERRVECAVFHRLCGATIPSRSHPECFSPNSFVILFQYSPYLHNCSLLCQLVIAVPAVLKQTADKIARGIQMSRRKSDIPKAIPIATVAGAEAPEWNDPLRGILVALVKDRRPLWDARFRTNKDRCMQLFREIAIILSNQDKRMNGLEYTVLLIYNVSMIHLYLKYFHKLLTL
uniref:MADF domain-containing protein n=1 Tax=Heterorhabditis bacteriophora TaxID=37862 RepID=A0A1I7X7I9_HETBA